MPERSTDLTLAFTLDALERLADPRAAIADAREWTAYVGAVSAAPNGALAFTRDRRIRLDFFSGTRPPAEALYGVRSNYHTERYVLVGVAEERDLAAEYGWDFQPVADAAERAGWALGAESGSRDGGRVGSLLARARAVLGG